jgi:Na+/proline symporter
VSGLVIAGILAAAMSTISSSINALASSMTNDLYAGWAGRRDPAHLLKVGRAFSLVWGVALVGAALGFHFSASRSDTPVVVLALSIASVTYGALLGTYILAGRWQRAIGRDVILGALVTIVVMLGVVFAARLAVVPALSWLAPVGRISFPWFVPIGTLITIVVGVLSSLTHPRPEQPA